MSQKTHPLFRWPSSLFWLLPMVASILLFWQTQSIGSLWWYLVVPTLLSFTLIDLFTKVWFGISTLTLLFIYSSVGSSGIPVSFALWEPETWRNVRESIEMTEFEWFHWWPFKWLIANLCLNMAIVTIRRIPFNILTVGVWTIHTGVIITVLGCVVYFSQKIEGDVVVSRARVEITLPNQEPVSMVATPDNSVDVGDWSFTISNLNPNWELMSGTDKGKKVYAVSVSVHGPKDSSFTRQLILGYPEYTEDVISTGDPSQPMARAKKVIGTALVDDSIKIQLTHDAKDRFFVTQSAAVYIQELSESGDPIGGWSERTIKNLPRFNDYIPDHTEVWGVKAEGFTPQPLSIVLGPSSDEDSLQKDVLVEGYLRYAFLGNQVVVGEELFPVVWVSMQASGGVEQQVELYAFDNTLAKIDPSFLSYLWLEDDLELKDLQKTLRPTIICTVEGKEYSVPLTNSKEFTQVGNTAYAFRLKSLQNNLRISGITVSLAQVEIQKGEQRWERWVFDNSELNRDVVADMEHEENQAILIDDAITMKYLAGGSTITIVGGLEDGVYGLLLGTSDEDPKYFPMQVGDTINLSEGVTITLHRAEDRTKMETKPSVVPPQQRDPSASNFYSMIKLVVPTPSGNTSAWIPYHQYPFESETESIERFRFEPTTFQLPDGKSLRAIFSRKSEPLPAPVALDSFEIDSHIGGFSGRTSSVLNWRSLIRFLGTEEVTSAVSVNDPQQYEHYWFFQSQWDPPTSTSAGLNYTVLGVGNRLGVHQMLIGCCITVSGMIWAFYVKPTIKRKRQQAVCDRSAA